MRTAPPRVWSASPSWCSACARIHSRPRGLTNRAPRGAGAVCRHQWPGGCTGWEVHQCVADGTCPALGRRQPAAPRDAVSGIGSARRRRVGRGGGGRAVAERTGLWPTRGAHCKRRKGYSLSLALSARAVLRWRAAPGPRVLTTRGGAAQGRRGDTGKGTGVMQRPARARGSEGQRRALGRIAGAKRRASARCTRATSPRTARQPDRETGGGHCCCCGIGTPAARRAERTAVAPAVARN